MKEMLLAVDDFNQPKTIENEDAYAMQLHHSISGRRGSRVCDTKTEGLAFEIKRFRFSELKDASQTIMNELVLHCQKYIPEIYIESINIIPDGEDKLFIYVNTSGKIVTESSIIFLVENDEPELLVNLISK